MMRKGVDAQTATVAGTISGAATYAGVKAPVTLGKAAVGQGAAAVARNAGYGATVSAASGVAERGSLRDLLERTGYRDQAQLLQPYDEAALATEAILGGIFSGGAAAIVARASARGERAVDAALTAQQARHSAIDTAPGVPADEHSVSAHSQALSQAVRQALRNEPVQVGDALADTTFVRSSSRDRQAREELRAHVADLLAEAPALQAPGTPRGLRNHNPGNIEATAERWQGQTGSDGRFATFETPEAGIRALARTLLTYQERHGLNTIEGIIGRWAPPSENDTAAYARAVGDAIGSSPTAPLNLREPATLRAVTEAIIWHENGQHPYSGAVLRAGVEAALGRPRGAPGVEPRGVNEAALRPAEAMVDAPAAAALHRLPDLPEATPLLDSEARRTLTTIAEAESARRVADPASQANATAAARPGQNTMPRVSELEPMAVGPVMVHPREIATGQKLYRETSVQGLGDLLMDDQRAHGRQMFVSDNPDLAIGQGDNRGVQVVFREGSLSGAEHRKPGTGGLTGREYQTDMVAPRAIESFIVPAGFKPKSLRGVARRSLGDFDAMPQPDGSIRYSRRPAPDGQPGEQPVHADAERTQQEAKLADASTRTRQEPSETLTGEAANRPRAEPIARPATDPTVRAAEEAAAADPSLPVVLDDGTVTTAGELLARSAAERERAIRDAEAFEAAVNCFLRTGT